MITRLIHVEAVGIEADDSFKEVYAIHDQQNKRLVIAFVHYDKSIVLDTDNIDRSIEQAIQWQFSKDELKQVIDIVLDEMEL